MDIFQIYTGRAVEKCPRWKPRNSPNKIGNSFGGHPVVSQLKPYFAFHTSNLPPLEVASKLQFN